MVYLFIIVLAATIGIARLWLLQRREARAQWHSLHGLRTSLAKVTAPGGQRVVGVDSRRGTRPQMNRPSSANLAPLDPIRREAAKRRIEARRRSRPRIGP